MSEPGQSEEQGAEEEEREGPESDPETGEHGAGESPELGRDRPASPGEAVLSKDEQQDAVEAETQVAMPDDARDLDESQETEVTNAGKTDELEFAEEAETQAQRPDDGDPLKELQNTKEVGNSTATVKVVLVPEGHVMTVAFAIGLSIQELKCHLASELRVPVEVLQLSLDGRAVKEQQSLMELGVRAHSSTRMEMASTDPDAHPLRPLRPPEHDTMPDVITVQVQTDDGALREVVVEIERPRQRKALLGGYRHRLTGVEYHHAAVQTLPKRRPDRGVVIYSRDTQTTKVKLKAQQCPVNASTQMTGIGCYVSCINDRLVTPGKYVTADECHDRRLRAVICLQSYVRRWLAQQTVNHVRRERARRLAWLDLQEKRRAEEKEEQLRDRRRRWMNPQKREDFNLLYHALENWRVEEEERINASLRGAERKAALCSLLEQETQLIAAIGRHRMAVDNKAVEKFLDKSAAPHQWQGADGRLIEMDNEKTLRARELRDLYSSISVFTVEQEQRLQFLARLKRTVKEHDCKLTRDIVELIDREVDLMARHVKERNLEGLRQRICTLLLQYIKKPAFNPAAAKLLKVPQDPSQLKEDMLRCRCCRRCLRFRVTAGSALSTRCRHCADRDNIARPRDDFSLYKNILRKLRADEQRINEQATIPFLLQVEDVRYLVEVVWGSRSALQASSDLYNLVFVRWERWKDWSPWNCVLLSKEETPAHLEIQDMQKAYGTAFIRSVEHKHAVARRHFSQIPVVAKYLDFQPAAAAVIQVVSEPVARATGKHATGTAPDSAH